MSRNSNRNKMHKRGGDEFRDTAPQYGGNRRSDKASEYPELNVSGIITDIRVDEFIPEGQHPENSAADAVDALLSSMGFDIEDAPQPRAPRPVKRYTLTIADGDNSSQKVLLSSKFAGRKLRRLLRDGQQISLWGTARAPRGFPPFPDTHKNAVKDPDTIRFYGVGFRGKLDAGLDVIYERGFGREVSGARQSAIR